MRKKDFSTWCLLLGAVSLGSFTTIVFAGCKPPASNDVDTSTEMFSVDEGELDGNVTTDDAAASDSSATFTPVVESPVGPVESEAAIATPVEEAATEPAEAEQPAAAATPASEPEMKVAAAPTDAAPADAAPADAAATDERQGEQLVSTEQSVPPEVVMEAGGDWPQWGGTGLRNNSPNVTGLPTEFDTGSFDRTTGEWDKSEAKNIRWFANLGSQTYGNPVVAGGRVFVGTNNGAGYLKRYPADIDLGCLLCFDEQTGEFLWQHSSEKLITGRVHDWPLQGICSAALVEGDRLWFVTSRGEVRCLDSEGFYDDEDDGPVTGDRARLVDLPSSDAETYDAALAGLNAGEFTPAVVELLTAAGEAPEGEIEIKTVQENQSWVASGQFAGVDREVSIQQAGPRLSFFKALGPTDKQEADVIWVYNMMEELGVSQHNMASCSVTSYGDLLFINTSNGLDAAHINIPAPNAPSFICLNKNTGELLWSDASPGTNILHGQWSSPAVGEIEGVPQVLFAGGDGYLYSFRADEGQDGKPELLWKFDCNPKESKWILGGEGTRNNLIGTPVIHDGLVYLAVGQDPEHGEGEGHLWCIDPNKRGDVSPQLAVKVGDADRTPLPHKRIQAVEPENGEAAVDNPNSAAVWHYSMVDQNGDDQIDFEEEMHRTIGTVAIKDNVLYVADLSGLFHCLDAKGSETGEPIVHFTYDMLAQSWGSPLIADGYVFIGDEDGDIAIFEFGPENQEPISEINLGTSIYSTPVAANGTIYISTKDKLFAIGKTE